MAHPGLRFAGACLGIAAAALAQAQGVREVIASTIAFEQVRLSPDGRNLAWIESRAEGAGSPAQRTALFVRGAAGGEAVRIRGPRGLPVAEQGLDWSPDGRRLAFLSGGGPNAEVQLDLVEVPGGPPRTLAVIHGSAGGPRWSPDGSSLALLVVEGARGPVGAVEASEPRTGEVGEHPLEARLWIVDAARGTTRIVTPADTYVYEFDWSPDGRRLAVVSAKGDGDNNWWTATLGIVDASGGLIRPIHRPATQIAMPRWSPDGSQVAFIEGLMSDRGSTGGDLWVAPVDGGPARNLTQGRAASPSWLRWLPRTRELLFTEVADGGVSIGVLSPDLSRARSLWSGDEILSSGSSSPVRSLSVADDGVTLAAVRSSPSSPPEIWVGPAGAWTQATHANAGLKAPWGPVRRLAWSCDGRRVQGWLYYPGGFDPARRYPMVVSVHGGPSAAALPGWPEHWYGIQPALCASGYFVLVANPRGSFGQGEAFTAANYRDMGGGDFRDIMAGVDAAVQAAPIDPGRLGICGWSYGGYMTMWAVTQTHRFRAAVAGAGVANLLSYYGQNMIDAWMIPFFGASAYDDPQAYARCSPITFIRNVQTPTLVIAGERDKECPAAQSLEFWHALRTLGVETRLVVYDGEGHHFRDPAHIDDMVRRSLDWFDARLR